LARIRTIKPEFFKSDDIDELSSDTVRLLFIGLWTYVDDGGVGKDNPRLIKAELFPLREEMKSAEVDCMLTELHMKGRIIRYIHPLKGGLISVVGWHDHQKINNPGKKLLPGPETGVEIPCDQPFHEDYRSPTVELHEDYLQEQGTGNREQGTGSVEGESEGKPELFVLTPELITQVSEVDRLCALLEKLLKENGFRERITAKWKSDLEKLIRIDKRSVEDVELVIRWCQQDSFWYKNIRSPAKLREKFDRLVADAKDEYRKKINTEMKPIDKIIQRERMNSR